MKFYLPNISKDLLHQARVERRCKLTDDFNDGTVNVEVEHDENVDAFTDWCEDNNVDYQIL